METRSTTADLPVRYAVVDDGCWPHMERLFERRGGFAMVGTAGTRRKVMRLRW